MRQRNVVLGIAVFSVSLAFGQGPDRVLSFAGADTEKDCQEIATAIRTVTGISQASIGSEQKTLALRGDADQIAAAEWLFHELDRPAAQSQPPAEHHYRSGADDVMRVFYLANSGTPQDIYTLANVMRIVIEIQRMYPIVARGACALRGTEQQITAADWLFHQLDRAPGAPAKAAQTQT